MISLLPALLLLFVQSGAEPDEARVRALALLGSAHGHVLIHAPSDQAAINIILAQPAAAPEPAVEHEEEQTLVLPDEPVKSQDTVLQSSDCPRDGPAS